MSNERAIYPYYKQLYERVEDNNFLIDKSGQKIAELLAPRIVLNPEQMYLDFEGRKSPRKYITREEEWYHSCELKIDRVKDVQIWQQVSDDNGEINSNYGNLVYSRNNFSQFSNVANTLKSHRDSRQGIIVYTRPSIHYEWNSLGAGDFICTNYQHFFIRDNKLTTITSMRSNDCIFGTFNDIPWFHMVILDMYNELITEYEDLQPGEHIFIPNSFHVYERHFDKLKDLVEKNKHLDQS